MMNPEWTNRRQARLVDRLQEMKLDAAIVGSAHHVQYLTGHRPRPHQAAAAVVFADGRTLLVSANSPDSSATVDAVDAYDANWMGTIRDRQAGLAAESVLKAVSPNAAIGVDESAVSAAIAVDRPATSIEAALHELRRRKDPDELTLMELAARCCDAMYGRARDIIRPGTSEIDVFNELHAVAVKTAGRPLSALLGNDFACGVPGGSPRDGRLAAAGELYILDLSPAVDGYFSDSARTFSVDGTLTSAQHETWQAVVGIFPMIEHLIRPGVRCRDVYDAADKHLRRELGKPLVHHLGHGIGLQPHEGPHLNAKWDDVFLEGDVFTVEPGVYGEDLGGGMRIENQYLVVQNGVQNLNTAPLTLM